MNDTSQLVGVSMRGWICFLLALGLILSVVLKIPLDTQFVTICNSVLVAYVVNSRPFGTSNGHAKEPTDPKP